MITDFLERIGRDLADVLSFVVFRNLCDLQVILNFSVSIISRDLEVSYEDQLGLSHLPDKDIISC